MKWFLFGLAAMFFLFFYCSCATAYSAGGHVTDGCEVTTSARAPGYTIYVCPRPFPSKYANLNGQECSRSTREASSAKGPYVACGWTSGFTDRTSKEMFLYNVYLPENFEHELRHVRGEIGDDQ